MSLAKARALYYALVCLGSLCPSISGRCGPPSPTQPHIKPEVMALLKQSTEAYRKMKSFSADVLLKTERSNDAGSQVSETHFVLALDRANRFCYRDISDPSGTAAVSDGKKLINYKSDRNQFTESPAPADYKGINIVDDVTFEPLATYLIALMLQGDALADKDVRESLEKASIGPIVYENGKKMQLLHLLFGQQEESCDIFFGEDHLINKSTNKLQLNDGKFTQTEQLSNIKVDKPIDSAVFLYRPPSNAQKVDRFRAPQRAGDVLLTPPSTGPSTSKTQLAAYFAPPLPGMDPAVVNLISQASEAYGKLKSYHHLAVFRASGTSNGKKVDQSAKFSLSMVRPNRLSFKMVSKPNVAAVCDGKTFTDFRGEANKPGEYTQSAAPATIKGLHLDQDDFDPVAGSYLVALLLQENALSDPKLLGILLKSSVHTGIVADAKTWDALDFIMDGLTFVMYFDPATHLLSRTAAKVPNEDLLLTETFQDLAIDKPIADSEFIFAPPNSAKHVPALGH